MGYVWRLGPIKQLSVEEAQWLITGQASLLLTATGWIVADYCWHRRRLSRYGRIAMLVLLAAICLVILEFQNRPQERVLSNWGNRVNMVF